MPTEIRLRTGFPTVFCDFLRDSTIEKGKKLFEADHVSHVEEVRSVGKDAFIDGRVVPQTSISKTPYFVQVALDTNRNVSSAHCNCISGSDGKCKHTSAVIHYVNHERDESRTDKA